MAGKKVNIGKKPGSSDTPTELDQWVATRDTQPETISKNEKEIKMKRLTLDIPEELHKAIKRKSVDEGVPMVEMLRTLLEQHYL